MVSLEFFISCRTVALGSTQPLTEMSTRNIFWWGKCGRCVGLTTVPPLCAYCLQIWERQPPGTLWACTGTALPLPLPCNLWHVNVHVRTIRSATLNTSMFRRERNPSDSEWGGGAVVVANIQYYSPYSTPSDGTAGPSQHPQGHVILSEVRAKKHTFHFLVQKWVSRQRLCRQKG